MIDFNKIDPTLEGLKAALQETRSDFDSHNHDGFNSKTFQALSTQSLTAEVISIRKQNYSDSKAGFWVGLMANSPAMFIGEGSKYLKYDTVNGLQILGGTITGGLIRTGTGSSRIEINGTTTKMTFYDGGHKISEFDPSSSQGTGFTQIFFDDTNTDSDVGKFYYRYLDYAIEGGQFKSQEIGMFLYNFNQNTGPAIALISDNQEPTIVKMYLGGKLDGDILNYDGYNSLGNSTNKFLDIWCDELHYVTLTDISDKRLKKNIDGIGLGLSEVLKLNPVRFKWKKEKDGNKENKGYGFIAQEVREVIPEMVKKVINKEEVFTEDKKGRKIKNIIYKDQKVEGYEEGEAMLQIDMTPMIPMLVRAIQELEARVKVLENKP